MLLPGIVEIIMMNKYVDRDPFERARDIIPRAARRKDLTIIQASKYSGTADVSQNRPFRLRVATCLIPISALDQNVAIFLTHYAYLSLSLNHMRGEPRCETAS